MKKTQNVLIKGTKDGLTLHLDDLCSYEELKRELDSKLTENSLANKDRPLISVRVQVGNRYLTEDQQEEIKNLIRQKKNLVVELIQSNVMTREEAELAIAANEIIPVAKVIRSGQVLETPGDLLLVGDVNPGGTVRAGGNIFIMGALKGIAHAGCFGNSNAVVVASVMNPSQIRISHCINRAPDNGTDKEKREMECAYIDENDHIIIDRLQVLSQLRPNLTKLEGGR
ncbi:septum site-determining protein MinC [Bacillus sp. Y1]|jgi:septum site-determining protein MinC|uniref:septum site-determining protein MinC n=1 Tax=Robertmurraya sp. TaxID=2837525 RepID=UPI000E6AF962|nr:septum site-determining protein MinC [Bacillus sp. Y1]AYA77171.1 septum site-determining protein MinC [Bacillus sp. Y1]